MPRISSASALELEFLQKIIDKKIPYRFAQMGQEIKLKDVSVKIVNPPTAQVLTYMASNADNDLCVVAQVRYHNLSVLLTGDASSVAEDRLIARTSPELLTSDILKVGHHGSKASTSQKFLEAVSPRLAVISVGKDNKYGHPTTEVLDRIKPRPVYRTDRDGVVTFQYVKNQWLVKCALDAFTNGANSCMKRGQI
jgi:beta-lactamase superfamily II metal-dependent hydrolase